MLLIFAYWHGSLRVVQRAVGERWQMGHYCVLASTTHMRMYTCVQGGVRGVKERC